MKKIKFALPLLLLIVSSCKDSFFEVAPRGQLTAESFFKTEEHALLATNAVYNILRNWEIHVFSYIGCTDILSDDADKGSEPNDATFLLEMDNLLFDAGNLAPKTLWDGYYRAIFRANIAIERIPEIKMNAALQQRLIAEATFLRAYFYFNLVRWFGDVPLVTKQLTQDEFKQSRAKTSDVYAQIIKDLKAAIDVLPEKSKYAPEDLGRATKGAAKGLLAKVYLTQKDYTNAEKYALEVINSNEYALFPDYTRIFTTEGENSSESVFEVGATVTTERYDGGSQYNEVQGVRGEPNLGWGFNRPSDSFILEFEPGDPRRDATVLYEGEVLPDGSAIVQKNPRIFNSRFNQKAWVPTHPGGNGNGPGNIRLMRYADVLLIAAEAANENGKTAVALGYLNQVRKRARGANANILPDVTETDKVKLREKIWHERRVELGLEQQRWFDLVRTGQAEAALTKHGKSFTKNKHELLPIPQAEIDLSAGTLVQNPGY
ncbi:MAG: RagB/SusD family nutrient uptake outer membrane protein [Saprospiraceae bacterium]|nr:RagB/SusD family nutrient uptake outer membrane protein [Saprospiraceae bacterium]